MSIPLSLINSLKFLKIENKAQTKKMEKMENPIQTMVRSNRGIAQTSRLTMKAWMM